jgi:thiamine-monophosphate kinase
MDVSDGLAGDLAKLCAASAVSAVLDLKSVPLSKAAAALLAASAVNLAELIAGGDDYEILCAIPPAALEEFSRMALAVRVSVNPIGTIVAGDSPPKWLDAQGKELPLMRTSYSHF